MNNVPTDVEVQGFATAAYATCIIKTDGFVQCFGSNPQYQPPGDLGAVKSISAGYSYFCAVKVDGSVKCWGPVRNDKWDRYLQVPSDLGKVNYLETGKDNVCAVLEDATVRCWGVTEGGCPDCVKVPPTEDFKLSTLLVGATYNCALFTSDSTYKCWGRSRVYMEGGELVLDKVTAPRVLPTPLFTEQQCLTPSGAR